MVLQLHGYHDTRRKCPVVSDTVRYMINISKAERKISAITFLPVRSRADFLSETSEIRGQQADIFKAQKEKSCPPRILDLAKLSTRNKGEMKTFPEKPKRTDFFITRPALYEGRPSGWNGRTPDMNSKPYEEINIS